MVAVLAISVSAHAELTKEQVDQQVKEYTQSIANKSVGSLLVESGVGLGLSISHCGYDYTAGVIDAIAKSTDRKALVEKLEKIVVSSDCTIASAKMGVASSLLREKSASGFNSFMKEAEDQLSKWDRSKTIAK